MAKKKPNSNSVTIKDVNIQLDSPQLENVNTIEQVRETELFSHLNEKDRAEAEQKLLDILSKTE